MPAHILLNLREYRRNRLVRKLIVSSKSTSCCVDPIPTSMLKGTLDITLPTITRMINFSLTSGVFYREWKESVVKPLLKKPHLQQIPKNYRPVTNILFNSKIAEKAALKIVGSEPIYAVNKIGPATELCGKEKSIIRGDENTSFT